MKLTSKQTYKTISFILQNPIFTQTEAFNSTGVSWGRMNEVVQWLVDRNFVEKRAKKYELTDPAGLVSLFPLDRSMNSLVIRKFPLRLSKKQIIDRLPKEIVLCLDSAMEFYSNYWRSDRVCIYVEENSQQFRKIEKDFKPLTGGNTLLWLFKPDIKPETAKLRGFTVTSRLRTLIDMICDNKSYYAKDLYRQLWGIKFEE